MESSRTKKPAADPVAFAIVAVAFAARAAWLGLKPPHFDEGVNGYFVDDMVARGFYAYDPTNYHGPWHFYVLYFAQGLFGRSVEVLRWPVVLAGVLSVAVMLGFGRFLGRAAARWGAFAMAVSPAAVFYSRYSIHESWLLLGMLACAWGLIGAWRFGEAKYVWAAGAGAALAVLNKETAFAHLACVPLACGTLAVFELYSRSGGGWRRAAARWRPGLPAAVAGVCALIVLLFYSGFLLNPAGAVGLAECLGAWLKTGAEGQGHEKPFYYWLGLMARYEWPALAGLAAGAALAWPRGDRLGRFLAIHGAGVLLAYSLVAYKTPWCILPILWPFWLLFGMAMAGGAPAFAGARTAVRGALAATVLGVSAAAAVRVNWFRYDDDAEPYVYVQTYRDIGVFLGPLFRLARMDPVGRHLTGRVIVDSYHPLPWVLGDFTRVGYYGPEEIPERPDADFLLVDEESAGAVEERLRWRYFRETAQLRSGKGPVRVYFAERSFAGLFPGRLPDIAGEEGAGR